MILIINKLFFRFTGLFFISSVSILQIQSSQLEKEKYDSLINNSSDTLHLSIIVAGDVMQHDSQINSAFDSISKKYNYDSCFSFVAPILKKYDIAVANLEVTLAGKPYKGYPQFSAPDELAFTLKKNGFNCLLTANNHSCDKGKQGIIRTISLLDSIGIPHLGTYTDSLSREKTFPLIVYKNGFKLGFLNYTYGTNGIPAPKPTIVNLIDTTIIKNDIEKATDSIVDLIIVFMHWGIEYQRMPNKLQKELANFCLLNGADFVIGSHPHVLQAMQKIIHPADSTKQAIIAYSLGNYVSNQRKRYTDGGAMIGIHLSKIISSDSISKIKIDSAGYYLTYVHKIENNHKQNFYIIPTSKYENDTILFKDTSDIDKLKLFTTDSRQLYNKNNININEFVYDTLSNAFSLKIIIKKDSIQKDSLMSFKKDTIYKIQFFVSSNFFDTQKLDKKWQEMITKDTVKDSLTRYMLGEFTSYNKANEFLIDVKYEFPDAFIVSFFRRK